MKSRDAVPILFDWTSRGVRVVCGTASCVIQCEYDLRARLEKRDKYRVYMDLASVLGLVKYWGGK